MENLRVFIAIDFCQETLQQIIQFQKLLIKDGFQEIHWVKENNLHLTVKFLGETALEKITLLEEQIDRVSATFAPFQLNLNGMGVFPGWKNPRIFWLGFKESNPLKILVEKIECGCKDLGFAAEIRPFSPHLTIGRFNQYLSSQKTTWLRERCSHLQFHTSEEIVSRVNLYRSILKPSGAEYSQIHSSLFKI